MSSGLHINAIKRTLLVPPALSTRFLVVILAPILSIICSGEVLGNPTLYMAEANLKLKNLKVNSWAVSWMHSISSLCTCHMMSIIRLKMYSFHLCIAIYVVTRYRGRSILRILA